MNTLFKMFFDLESIPDDADGLVISWINPISGWVWLMIILILTVVRGCISLWEAAVLHISQPGRPQKGLSAAKNAPTKNRNIYAGRSWCSICPTVCAKRVVDLMP